MISGIMEIFPLAAPDSLMYSWAWSGQGEDGRRNNNSNYIIYEGERGHHLFKTNGWKL